MIENMLRAIVTEITWNIEQAHSLLGALDKKMETFGFFRVDDEIIYSTTKEQPGFLYVLTFFDRGPGDNESIEIVLDNNSKQLKKVTWNEYAWYHGDDDDTIVTKKCIKWNKFNQEWQVTSRDVGSHS